MDHARVVEVDDPKPALADTPAPVQLLVVEEEVRIEAADRATAIAHYVCELSPETIRRGLAFVEESRDLGAAGAVALAARHRALNFASPDFAEGVRAFHEKRKPVWPSLS